MALNIHKLTTRKGVGLQAEHRGAELGWGVAGNRIRLLGSVLALLLPISSKTLGNQLCHCNLNHRTRIS
jgi:hypothetical protein